MISPLLGGIFESWAANNIYRQFSDLNMPPQIYHWQTNGGAKVDIILERDNKLYPIEIKAKINLNKHDSRGLRALHDTYPQEKIEPGLIIYAGNECYMINENVTALPWNTIVNHSIVQSAARQTAE